MKKPRRTPRLNKTIRFRPSEALLLETASAQRGELFSEFVRRVTLEQARRELQQGHEVAA